MTLYRCTKRIQTADGAIHEVGTLVDLTGQEEQGALLQSAVVIEPMQPVVSDPVTLPDLQKERAQLDEQIATMEHEGVV